MEVPRRIAARPVGLLAIVACSTVLAGNIVFPVLRFTSDQANYFFVLGCLVLLATGVLLLHVGSRSAVYTGVTIAAFAPLSFLALLQVFYVSVWSPTTAFGGHDDPQSSRYRAERLELDQGSAVTGYILDWGLASEDTGEVRQEWKFLPGLLLVREVHTWRNATDGVRLTDRGGGVIDVRTSDLHVTTIRVPRYVYWE